MEGEDRYRLYPASPPPPGPEPKSGRRFWVVLALGTVLCVLGGLALTQYGVDAGFSEADGLDFAGLPDPDEVEGVELTAYESTCGIDCFTTFVFVGTPEAVDRLLAASGVGASLASPTQLTSSTDDEDEAIRRLMGVEWPTNDVDFEPIVEPGFAEDVLRTEANLVRRRFLRSTLPHGQEQLIVDTAG